MPSEHECLMPETYEDRDEHYERHCRPQCNTAANTVNCDSCGMDDLHINANTSSCIAAHQSIVYAACDD